MPDRQNWTAAMVLEWVLSRDMQAVLAIAADHGAVEVDTVAKKVTEIRPASMRDVERTHAIDESISDQGEKIARAIVWGDLKGIPARREIYDALKQGELEARSRRNGRGDLVVIERDQWLSLKLYSVGGHELALPVDINGQQLPLPNSFDDYLAACVPIDATPTVWPDPLFGGDQAKKRWPAAKQRPAQGGREPSQSQDQPYNPPMQASELITKVSLASGHEQLVGGVLSKPTVPSRPDGISDKAWARHQRAGELLGKYKNISGIARAIAREEPGNVAAVRRDIHRVNAALSTKS
jgi:hypothetical protein